MALTQSRRPRSIRQQAAIGYVRRSTDRQEQSIGDQKKAIDRYCHEQGLHLLRFYIDDAISGTSTIGRNAFQQMVADAKHDNCDFGHVVVYDVKRFGRIDNDEAGYWRHMLRTHGVAVAYVSENFAGDGTDDLLRPVKQWQAREESKDLAKVTIRGLLSRHRPEESPSQEMVAAIRLAVVGSLPGGGAGGWWMGGAPPYGFDLRYESQSGEFLFHLRYQRDGSKHMLDQDGRHTRTLQRRESVAVSKRDRCRLVPSEQSRVSVIKRIFHMYVDEGRGFKAIASALNRDGVPPHAGQSGRNTTAGSGLSRPSVRYSATQPMAAIWSGTAEPMHASSASQKVTPSSARAW